MAAAGYKPDPNLYRGEMGLAEIFADCSHRSQTQYTLIVCSSCTECDSFSHFSIGPTTALPRGLRSHTIYLLSPSLQPKLFELVQFVSNLATTRFTTCALTRCLTGLSDGLPAVQNPSSRYCPFVFLGL
eukprot:TRINITY_DN1476_c0_g3_i2.p1 TRINITY_DN1476_c0_g3~~TRINITY_DN1476_c0_g3_i2.p1  ORF type:complete len:129 (-),score=5.85 TRINITY_DN1476_c0_g3_i2:89-475(-)